MTKEMLYQFFETTIWLYLATPLFLGFGAYITYKARLIQFRYVKDILDMLFEKPENRAGITPFQAFSLSLGSRIGAGKIVGVALAIGIGGPGAIFWLWVSSFIGMTLTLIENVLSQVYKVKQGDLYQGGPAYYIREGLNSPKMGAFYAVLMIVIYGVFLNSIQTSALVATINSTFDFDPLYFIVFMMMVVSVIIFGGLRRIAHVTQAVIPFLLLFYAGITFYIVASHISDIPRVFSLIISSAFGAKEILGGGFGIVVMQGMRNGILSHETGVGTVSVAGATANTRHPVNQGLIQSLGIFLDTFIMSTGTAFIILQTGLYDKGVLNGMLLMQASMSVHLGNIGPYIISVMLLLFSLTTFISNYYYGEANMTYLSHNRKVLIGYRVLIIGVMFMGVFMNLGQLWNIAIILIGIAILFNLITLCFLSKTAYKVINHYVEERRKGIKQPQFYQDSIEGLKGVECWPVKIPPKEMMHEDRYFKAMPPQ